MVDVLLLHHSIYNHFSIALPASVILFTFSQLSKGPMVICLLVSDLKLWEIIFEVNFSFCSQYMTRNWTFDKFNLRITSEASFKEG